MRKTEGVRVPPRSCLIQGNTVTLHSQSGRKLVAGAFRLWAQSEAHFELIINND